MTPPPDVKSDVDLPMRAHVLDEKGKPVKNAKVEMTVTMVDMDHGTTTHEAKESAAGTYEAPAKFLMQGTWNVKVKAQKGSESAVQDFKIEVKQ